MVEEKGWEGGGLGRRWIWQAAHTTATRSSSALLFFRIIDYLSSRLWVGFARRETLFLLSLWRTGSGQVFCWQQWKEAYTRLSNWRALSGLWVVEAEEGGCR